MDLKTLNGVAEIAARIMGEGLKGDQHKIDANKNNKIDAHDFKLLRAKKDVKEETVEEAMQKADVPAYLRKQKGEKPLSVTDVKGPRTDSISSKESLAKARNEEVEQIEEADIEKTSTGMRVYGSSYGNSVRARREQVKKSIDTAKGPKSKDIESIEAEKKKKKKFSEMVESYIHSGVKSLFNEEPSQEEFNKEIEVAKKKAKGELRNDKNIAAGKVEAVKEVEEEVQQVEEQIEQVEERTMTEPEMKKREEIVKSMKKGIQGFKDRYGDRAKSVMYATATKQAMKD